jgi:hypothetical protein
MQALLTADVYGVNWFGTDEILDISNHAGASPVKDPLDILKHHLHEHPLLPMVHRKFFPMT